MLLPIIILLFKMPLGYVTSCKSYYDLWSCKLNTIKTIYQGEPELQTITVKLIPIKNTYGLKSINTPDQFIVMSADNQYIFLPHGSDSMLAGSLLLNI
jgi:hypothetical protein